MMAPQRPFTSWILLLFSLLAACSPASSETEKSCDTTQQDRSSSSCSATPPPLELPQDFVDPCQDSNKDCLKWSQQGECTFNKNYMIEFCPRSCNSCRPMKSSRNKDDDTMELNPNCIDSRPECFQWAGEGECLLNPSFMLNNCRLSCWRCVNIPSDRAKGVDEQIIAKKLNYSRMNFGKHQLVSRGRSSRSFMVEMENYAKHVVADPNFDPKMRERCFNQHRMCAEWAGQGKCLPSGHTWNSIDDASSMGADSVLFMMNMCPLACQMCHELESFHKCSGKRVPWEKASFDSTSESINSFFERTDLPYDPVFVSRPDPKEESSEGDPYVVVLQHFLSSDEADTLKSLPRSTAAGWDLNADAKSNRVVASCPNDNVCSQNETFTMIMDRISSLLDVEASHLEPIEIIQFEQHTQSNTINQLEHNFEVNSLWKPAGPRILSLFIFLSDANVDEEEQIGSGGLGFPYLDWLSIKPKKGMAVLWPNVRSDDLRRLDPLTKFEYFPSQEKGGDDEVHFGAMSHVRLFNYTDAYLRGCA